MKSITCIAVGQNLYRKRGRNPSTPKNFAKKVDLALVNMQNMLKFLTVVSKDYPWLGTPSITLGNPYFFLVKKIEE
jgi:hypothetical protein